jgi:hypothetical protein
MSPAIWIVVGAFAFIGALFALMALPANVRVRVVGEQLLVEPMGLDKMWCVRGTVAIATDRVADVAVVERNSIPRPGLLLPGAYLPGVITAGSYGLGAHRTFWDVRRASRLLVVTCRPGAPYHQLVVEVAEPEIVCSQLRTHL